MPESLLARIIRVSSHEGDWVLDPFCGSGTTATVARKLGRVYSSTDMSAEYVKAARKRVANCEGLPVEGEGLGVWPEHAEAELRWLYSENKVPYSRLCASAALLSIFTAKLNQRLQKTDLYTPEQVKERLTLLEDRGALNAQLSDRFSSV